MGTYFGGGSAAVAAVPVRPRGATGLVTAALAGLGCLALAALAGTGLATLRRVGGRGQHAAAPRPAEPAWSGSRVQASWPDAEEPGWTGAGAGQPDPGTLPDFASRVLDVADIDPAGPGDVLR